MLKVIQRQPFFPIFFTIVIFLSSGCSTIPKFNEDTLVELYSQQRRLPKKNPLIFIPGIMGTVLKDKKTGRTVWGEVGNRLINTLALPIDTVTLIVNRDSLVAAYPIGKIAVIPGLVEKEIYDRVYRIVIQAGGYEMKKNAFTLTYDWRRDLVEAAKQLGELIERIKLESGQPDIKVNLLCHSMGGLIARYYVKYGTVDVLDQNPLPAPTYAGSSNINKIIMLGTPNCGSLEAFQRLHEGLKIPMVGNFSPETVFTMPSVYELLPFEGKSVFVTSQGLPLEINIYDSANWEKYGWSVFSPRNKAKKRKKFFRDYGKQEGKLLYDEYMVKQQRFLATVLKRTERFHQALLQGDSNVEKQHVSYALLGSDCQRTLQRAVLEKEDSGWKTLFKAKTKSLKDILYGFGDGSITKESLLGIRYKKQNQVQQEMYHIPSSHVVFVCDIHGNLALSPTYLDNVLNMLLDKEQ